MKEHPTAVLVYGDSLALPRATDGIGYLDTYGEIVRAALQADQDSAVALYNRAKGGAPIRRIYSDWVEDATYFGRLPQSMTIIQTGIVDCAPRPIPAAVRRGVGVLPAPFRKGVVRILHNNRARLIEAGPTWRTTSPGRFASTLRRWLTELSSFTDQTYVLTIAPTTAGMDDHSPGLAESIDLYNAVIRRLAAEAGIDTHVVDVFALIQGAGGPSAHINQHDGHHLTKSGHALIADAILERHREFASV